MRSFFRLTNIRRQRSLKKMSTSYNTKSSPRVYIQVLGAETKDTSPSLFVFADSQRYVVQFSPKIEIFDIFCSTFSGGLDQLLD